VLGIRPDVIRASIIMKILRSAEEINVKFIWSGQHYSDNLKDIFFRELEVDTPDIELDVAGVTDAQIMSSVNDKLFQVLKKLQPSAVVFLGDTNTVMGCLAAVQLNIPIIHIEGCMRSYDWRMPEEKYRIIIDHLSDVIYAYLEEYKRQGVAEGLNADGVVVTGNPIVDVLDKYYFARKECYERLSDRKFFRDRELEKSNFYLMTCHRRENVCDLDSLRSILDLVEATSKTVYFPASYRIQKILRTNSLKPPGNVIMVDPIGYQEFLALMSNSCGVITDSGTVVEEACILQIPAIQTRRSTERPQVYDVGACVKFDPTAPEKYPHKSVFAKLEALRGKSWPNPFGDGRSSERIAHDILDRLETGRFDRHYRTAHWPDISRSFKDDGL